MRLAATVFAITAVSTALLFAWTRVVEASWLALPFWLVVVIYLAGVGTIAAGLAALYGRWTRWTP